MQVKSKCVFGPLIIVSLFKEKKREEKKKVCALVKIKKAGKPI